MSSRSAQESTPRYGVDAGIPHGLHESRTASDFRERFEATTGCAVESIADDIVAPEAPRAIFLVGSLPLGMATNGSDVDFLVLVHSRAALQNRADPIANSDRQLVFSNESDALLAGMFLTDKAGIYLDVQVAITPEIRHVQNRLRRRGPELSDSEIRTLGRLGTGWLLWQTEGYLEREAVLLNDPALAVYCCTKNFVSALIHQRKALKALELEDFVSALQLGRSSVELAYLAFLASEAMPYLGAKWPAQIGYARGAAERLNQHPLLRLSIPLLFPPYSLGTAPAAQYLRDVGDFLASMQTLIEQKMLFRIAFKACAQIGAA